MSFRRKTMMALACTTVALGTIGIPAIADELFGVITKVDVEGKKLMVLPKDADKEIEVTVTGDTEVVTKKGSTPLDLEKLSKGVAKAQDAGKKGVMVKIEHEKGVASKITYQAKKKAEIEDPVPPKKKP